MKKIKTLSFIIIVVFVFSGCEPCLNSTCSDSISFNIIDMTNRQDLVFGPSPIYKLDSMKLQSCQDTSLFSHCRYYTSISYKNKLLFVRPRFPFDTFYLRLSHSDIDTLIIDYDYRETQCCGLNGYGKINGISYNGKTASTNGNAFIFEK